MSKIIVTTVYQFDELSETAKEKARDWYFSAGLGDDWANDMIEDAKMIGLEITGYDVGRGQSCDGKFIESARECAELILKNHGDQCETFKTAQKYMADRVTLLAKYPQDAYGDFIDQYGEFELEEMENDFLKSILEDYRILLTKDFEYRQSGEYIDEMLRISEYTFTAEGKRFG